MPTQQKLNQENIAEAEKSDHRMQREKSTNMHDHHTMSRKISSQQVPYSPLTDSTKSSAISTRISSTSGSNLSNGSTCSEGIKVKGEIILLNEGAHRALH